MERGYLSHCRNFMKTCIHTQNFIEIEQSTAELWPKTIFNIAAVRHLIFKKNYISSSDCHRVPNLLWCTKFHWNWMIFLFTYCDLMICNMMAVPHLEFSKFRDFVTFMAMLFCFPAQNFTEIGQLSAELWPKIMFKMATVRHLKFLKISIFGHVTVIKF